MAPVRAMRFLYHRGIVTVLDRPGLEAAACERYGAITAACARQRG